MSDSFDPVVFGAGSASLGLQSGAGLCFRPGIERLWQKPELC